MNPSNFRYRNGFKWCGFCGEWQQLNNTFFGQRCSYCGYILRLDALLKGKRKPEEVHRY